MPHNLTIKLADGTIIAYQPTIPGGARVTSTPGTMSEVQATSPSGDSVMIPVAGATTWGETHNLPEPQDDTIYVVSLLVAQRNPRPDVFSPGTGPQDGAIRENGQIVAVTRLNASV